MDIRCTLSSFFFFPHFVRTVYGRNYSWSIHSLCPVNIAIVSVRWLLTTVAHNCHGNINLATAISIWPQQFQFGHGKINLATAISIWPQQNQFENGNFNLATAISIWPRQNQFGHGKINLATAISIWPRQNQFGHGNINIHT